MKVTSKMKGFYGRLYRVAASRGRRRLTEDCCLFPGAVKCSEMPARERGTDQRGRGVCVCVQKAGEKLEVCVGV